MGTLRIEFTYADLTSTMSLLTGNNTIALYAHKIAGNTKLSYIVYNSTTGQVSNFDGSPITHAAFMGLGLDIDTTIIFGTALHYKGKTGIKKTPIGNFCMNLLSQLGAIHTTNAKYYLYLRKPAVYHKVSYGIIKNGEVDYMRGGGGGPGATVVEKAP